jgi:hypothetical protein
VPICLPETHVQYDAKDLDHEGFREISAQFSSGFSFCRYGSGPHSGVPVCSHERHWRTATLDRDYIKISWRARGMRIGSDSKPDTSDALGTRLVFATAESRALDMTNHYIA